MILLGDSAKILKDFNDECIDLTVTSPPYDNIRSYNDNHSFDFIGVAKQLYRITKEGGIVCWIVSDITVNSNESGTSFKQALYFKETGFKLNDTMIYLKGGQSPPHDNKYEHHFEYMFILSKGKPKTFNAIIDRNNFYAGSRTRGKMTVRNDDDLVRKESAVVKDVSIRWNVWYYATGMTNTTTDEIAFNHPAIFPDRLAQDLIISYSNEGDIILDPFLGSGTTYKMAYLLNRKPVGIEINPEYVKIAKERLKPYIYQQKLLNFIA